MLVVSYAGIWTVLRRRLLSGAMWIVTGYGRVTLIRTIGAAVDRDPRGPYRSIWWWERRPDPVGCYHFDDGAGAVRVVAQTAASHPSGAATAPQTFGFGAIVTTATMQPVTTATLQLALRWKLCCKICLP